MNFRKFSKTVKKKTTNSHINKYRILTTTGCNAKCFYCYEQGIKHYSMNSETAIKVAEFIINHIGQRNTIQIEWFGGEPLLNIPAIELITNYIYTNKPDYVSYRSSIITNASKINETLVSKMSNDWFTTRVQITIDGVGSVYEKIKQLGKGSFEHVIESIGLLVNNGIQVDIRLNFNNKNIADIENVIKYFSQYPYKDKITIYAAKIFSSETKRGYFDLENETIYIDNLLHRYGFKSKRSLMPRIFKTSCMATYPGFFTIDPKGTIFKCDRRLLDKNSIATVYNYSDEIIYKTNWNNLEVADKCKRCKLYPMCWGGCIYDRLNNIYPCYLTEKIISNNLKLLLEDYKQTQQNWKYSDCLPGDSY